MVAVRRPDEEALLSLMWERFSGRGYENTCMRDLIEITGLDGATIYSTFGDKESIYRRVAMSRVALGVGNPPIA